MDPDRVSQFARSASLHTAVPRAVQLPGDGPLPIADHAELPLRPHPPGRALRQKPHVARRRQRAVRAEVLERMPDREAECAVGGRAGHQHGGPR
jgi:hypothetical protein